MAPHMPHGHGEKRVEAGRETFPADDQAAVLPLEPGERLLGLEAQDLLIDRAPTRLSGVPHPFGELRSDPASAQASVAGRGGAGAHNRRRPESATLGGGAYTLMDEPFSAHPGALGQKARTLFALSPVRLCPHRIPCGGVIRIGSKSRPQASRPSCRSPGSSHRGSVATKQFARAHDTRRTRARSPRRIPLPSQIFEQYREAGSTRSQASHMGDAWLQVL